MKRLLLITVFFLFCTSSALFAQESERDYVDEQNMTVSEVEELIQSQSFINKIDFVFGVEPAVSINTHSKIGNKFVSAPSPMYFPVYIGLSYPNYTAISFQPSLRFFMSYHLVYDDMVLPAEIENRTGLTFNFLVNLPVVFKLNYRNKYSWSVIAGLAGLIRFATVPFNVEPDAPGTTGTVKSDVDYTLVCRMTSRQRTKSSLRYCCKSSTAFDSIWSTRFAVSRMLLSINVLINNVLMCQ